MRLDIAFAYQEGSRKSLAEQRANVRCFDIWHQRMPEGFIRLVTRSGPEMNSHRRIVGWLSKGNVDHIAVRRVGNRKPEPQ